MKITTGLARNSRRTTVHVDATVRASPPHLYGTNAVIWRSVGHHGESPIEPSVFAQLGGPGCLLYNT